MNYNILFHSLLNYPEKPHKEQIIQTLLVYLLIFFFLEKIRRNRLHFIKKKRKFTQERRKGSSTQTRHTKDTTKTPTKHLGQRPHNPNYFVILNKLVSCTFVRRTTDSFYFFRLFTGLNPLVEGTHCSGLQNNQVQP